MKLSLYRVWLSGFLVALLGATLGCSDPQSSTFELENSNGIIGGSEAQASDPLTASTVSLLFSSPEGPIGFCSGILISKNLVLTATHCFEDVETFEVFVFFGEKLPTSMNDSHIVAVAAWKAHPDFRYDQSSVSNTATGFNDVGLVLLAADAPAHARPAVLLNELVLPIGQNLLLAGYGLVAESPDVMAKGLNYARVPLVKSFENILVTDQNKAVGACTGDSGGPAFLETVTGLAVLGITRGPHDSAADCHHFGEYTYVARFKDYILQSATELHAEPPTFVDVPSLSIEAKN